MKHCIVVTTIKKEKEKEKEKKGKRKGNGKSFNFQSKQTYMIPRPFLDYDFTDEKTKLFRHSLNC